MLVNERVLIIYPSDLFSVEFNSGISTTLFDLNTLFHFFDSENLLVLYLVVQGGCALSS